MNNFKSQYIFHILFISRSAMGAEQSQQIQNLQRMNNRNQQIMSQLSRKQGSQISIVYSNSNQMQSVSQNQQLMIKRYNNQFNSTTQLGPKQIMPAGKIKQQKPSQQSITKTTIPPLFNRSSKGKTLTMLPSESKVSSFDYPILQSGLAPAPLTEIITTFVTTTMKGTPGSHWAKVVSNHNTLTPITNRVWDALIKQSQSENSFQQIKLPKQQQIFYFYHNRTTYQGPFSQGLPHGGPALTHFPDGSFYYGNFVNGAASGMGIYIYSDGSIFQGRFRQSSYNGYGLLFYRVKGMKFSGQFVAGRPHGKGEEMHDQGQYYCGDFRNGLKEGYGICRWNNDLVYQGQFRNDTLYGNGMLMKNQQIIFKGRFKNGIKQGPGLFLTPNASYYGTFSNDLLQGPGSVIYKDGRIETGNFVHSKLNGKGWLLYPQTDEGAQVEWLNGKVKTISNNQKSQQISKGIIQIKRMHLMASESKIQSNRII